MVAEEEEWDIQSEFWESRKENKTDKWEWDQLQSSMYMNHGSRKTDMRCFEQHIKIKYLTKIIDSDQKHIYGCVWPGLGRELNYKEAQGTFQSLGNIFFYCSGGYVSGYISQNVFDHQLITFYCMQIIPKLSWF